MDVRWQFLSFLLLIGSYRCLGKYLDDLLDNVVSEEPVSGVPSDEVINTAGSSNDVSKLSAPNTNLLATKVISIEVPTAEVPASEVATTDVPANKAPTTEVLTNEFSTTEVPANEVPTTDVPANKAPTTEVLTNEFSTTEVPANEVPITEVPANKAPTTEVLTNEFSTTEVPSTEVPANEALTTEPPNIQTVKSQMTALIKDTMEVCNRIRKIDIYENIVMSTLPLRQSLSYQTRFNKYSEEYNRDLKEIQDHMKFWRKGNDVVGEMRSIYGLAKNFEDEFLRKLAIWRERMLRAPAESQRLRKILSNKIKELKKEKENLESSFDKVDEVIKPYIAKQIKETQSALNEKRSEKRNSTPLAMELKELAAFLGFVRDDAIAVKNKTINVAKRLKELYNTIQKDNDTVLQYIANITSDVQSLTSEKLELEGSFTLTNTKLRELEKQLEAFDGRKSKIFSDNDEPIAEFNNINSQFQKTRNILKTKQDKLCHKNSDRMRTKPPLEYVVQEFDHSLVKDFAVLSDLTESKKKTFTKMQANNDEVNKLQPQINDITDEIRMARDRMSEIEAKTKEIQRELSQFNMFQSDVENLISGIENSMPYISETREGLLILHTTFEFVIGHIDNITGQAESAKVEERRQVAKEIAEEALEFLNDQLSDSSNMMTDLSQCSMLGLTISI